MMGKKFLEKAYHPRTEQETQEMYDAWAATYDLEVADENDYQQPLRCAKALMELFKPDQGPVLDVGCGTGLAGIALKESGYELVDGCDFSNGMLDKAKAIGVYRRLFFADLNKPPMDVADSFYAAATAVGIFSFGHLKAEAIDEIIRVIRPGGVLIIGLNEHFYDEGSLTKHLEKQVEEGRMEILKREYGEHLPGTKTGGWVISIRKM